MTSRFLPLWHLKFLKKSNHKTMIPNSLSDAFQFESQVGNFKFFRRSCVPPFVFFLSNPDQLWIICLSRWGPYPLFVEVIGNLNRNPPLPIKAINQFETFQSTVRNDVQGKGSSDHFHRELKDNVLPIICYRKLTPP